MRHLAWLLPVTAMLFSSVSDARVEESLGYTKQQSYNAALRFIRVDRGYNLVEKDMDSGYLLFEYPIGGSTEVTHGSIEIVERKEDVALIIQLPQMPRYHERMLASGLLRKLQADYGAPRTEKKPAPEKEPARDEKAPRDNQPVLPGDPPPKK